MLTGADLNTYFDNKWDKSYSGYIDITKKNRIFRDALFTDIEKKYKELSEQKNYDELSFAIKTEKTFRLNNNQIFTAPILISSVTGASNTFTITTVIEHNLKSGDFITIEGVTGSGTMSTCNTTLACTVVSSTVFTISVGGASGTHDANTGSITNITSSGIKKIITNYHHLLSVESTYLKVTLFKVKEVKAVKPLRLIYTTANTLRTGMYVYLDGTENVTSSYGYFYIKKIGSKTVDLYYDKDFVNAVESNAFVLAQIKSTQIVVSKYCTPQISDRKIGVYNKSTVEYPKHETSERQIKIYPLNETCKSIKIDYISLPKEIDLNDDTIDLSFYYNDTYLYYIIDEALLLAAKQTRDTEFYQLTDKEIKENP